MLAGRFAFAAPTEGLAPGVCKLWLSPIMGDVMQ
jgi:hypothetical protein